MRHMLHSMGRAKGTGVLVPCLLAVALLAACSSTSSTRGTGATSGRVLLVGTFSGHRGSYATIQSAVNAAHSGDWILVAPGDYHENADKTTSASDASYGDFGGVLITKSNIHLRGMSRSKVIVDGTRLSSSTPCSSDPADQNFGPVGSDGKADGRNGILVWKANNVSVENLTACNFLGGTGDAGNQIWWNGGDGTGKIGLTGYSGRYLTATSTYFGTEDTAAQYGIFSSASQGPATWTQLYASNFNDSGMYVGACKQVCDITISHAHMQYDALGYSGTNSGGAIVIENSEFDHNEDGADTNTQLNGDPLAPQNGACPHDGISPVTHTHSCWVFIHNSVHDNNNGDVPMAGSAAAGPTGTGMTVSGGRNDTVMDNTFSNNGAWGILFVPYPDDNTPSLHQTCSGTGGVEVSGLGCVYDPEGDALLHNTFQHNGYFGNPSNGDYGQITVSDHQSQNCYAGNVAPDGSTPADLEKVQATCGASTTAANEGGALLAQVLCDSGITGGACPAGANYPQAGEPVMHRLPADLPSMPNPCQGVPDNAWCPNGRPA
jgi:hypothetical protein